MDWDFVKKQIEGINNKLDKIDGKVDEQGLQLVEIVAELGLKNGNGLKRRICCLEEGIKEIQDAYKTALKTKLDRLKAKPGLFDRVWKVGSALVTILLFLFIFIDRTERQGAEKAAIKQQTVLIASTPEPTPTP